MAVVGAAYAPLLHLESKGACNHSYRAGDRDLATTATPFQPRKLLAVVASGGCELMNWVIPLQIGLIPTFPE